jgi:outer membrane protein assembly factor BamB
VTCRQGSFIASFDLRDGRELWRTARKDVPTWGTPTLVQTTTRTQIVANGWHETAGYDFATGAKLWTLDGGGDIPVPTPIFAHSYIYLTSAHGRWRPIRAIRPEANGRDHTGRSGQDECVHRVGARTPGQLHADSCWSWATCSLAAMTMASSPASTRGPAPFISASDSRSAVKASPRRPCPTAGTSTSRASWATSSSSRRNRSSTSKGFHPLPETCMATPAISDGTLFFRTRHQLIAIGEGARSAGVKLSSQTAAAAEPPKLDLKKPDAALVGEWQGTIQIATTKLRGRFSIRDAGAEMKGNDDRASIRATRK